MKTTQKLLGSRIKELRKQRSLSQEKLSEKIGIDPKHLSRLEVGHGFPSLNVLEKLANALNVEIKDFFEFAHAEGTEKEIRKNLGIILKEANEEKLRTILKIARAVIR